MTKIAVVESKRSNEFRVPIHPKHFGQINSNNDVYFQTNYAEKFEINNLFLDNRFKLNSRDNLLKTADVIFLLKPTKTDLEKVKEGATIIGWCHAIQQIDIAKTAVKRKLTLIAMEAMYEFDLDGKYLVHLFHENNYITGFEGIAHAFSNAPLNYSDTARVAIISYGNVSYGAAKRLKQLGYKNITVFTRRKSEDITNKIEGIEYHTLQIIEGRLFDKDGQLLNKILCDFDVIINGIKQDPITPYNYLTLDDLKNTTNKLLIDLSCDENMGFEFSHETTWETPIVLLYNNYYYAVPNIPTIAWETVSEIISSKLLPILNAFIRNKFSSDMLKMLEQATEIKAGEIINQKIIQYQKKLGFL